MPIRSKAQWRWLFKNKPRIARRWAHHTTTKFKNLPTRVRKKRR